MTEETKPTQITSIKAFDHEFKCRGFQFEVGKTYTVAGKIKACENGFHAVSTDSPFHVWDFYPIIDDAGRLTRYAEVTQSGDTNTEAQPQGTKIASASLTVNVELSLPDFIKRAVSWIVDATKGKDESGDYAQIGSSGDYAQIGSSGDSAQIGSSGDSAQIGSSGDSARIGSSGYSARIGSSGDYARIVAEGKKAVVACAGRATTVSGADGAWISIAEYDRNGDCIGFATGCIGKGGLKAGVPYIAKGGKLVEAA